MSSKKDMEQVQEELFVDFAKKAKVSQNSNKKHKEELISLPIWAVIQERTVTLSLDVILLFFLTLFFLICMSFFWGVHRGRILSEKKLIVGDQHIMMDLYQSNQNNPQVSGEGVPSTPIESPEQPLPSSIQKNDNLGLKEEIPSVPKSQEQETTTLAKYTIRVASSKDKEATEVMLEKLKNKGFDGFIIKAPSKKGAHWNYLCVGRYTSSSEGEKTLKLLKEKEGFSDSFFYIL